MPNSSQEKLTAKSHLQRGHELRQKGRAREAIASYRHALGLEPNSAIASKTLARALKEQGKLAEAIIYYRQAIAIHAQARMRKQNTHSWELKPSSNQKMILTNSSNLNTNNIAAQVYMSQAYAYWQQKNSDETIAACEQALKNDPKLVEAYKLQGNVLQQQGKMLEAMGCYARALEINPEMPELYANLGSLYGKQQQWQEAIRYYQKALQLNPHIPGFYQNLAKIYHRSGEKDEATRCLLKAQSLSPGPQDAKVPKKVIEVAATPPTIIEKPQQLNDLGNSHAQKQEWQQAIACYQKAISQDPNFAGAYRNMARALRQVGKRQEAVECWNRALTLEPTWGKGKDHLRLGDIFLKQGQTEKAITCYRRSLQVEPDFAAGYVQLGHLLSQQGNTQEAIACWRQGVANIPDDGSLYFHLGQALALQEQWSEAIACYRRVIALEPERSEAYHNLGDMLQKEKQLQAAVASYRRAIELKPDFHWSHNNLGDALLQLEDWEAAATSYERSIELEPDFHWSHYNLAEALVQQKDWQGAIAAYRKAMELSPNLPYIHHKLANVLKADLKSSSQEAVDLYLKAVEEEPDNLEIYHEALEVAPNNAQLYFSLGKALANQGDSEQAAVFHNLALQMQPDAWQETVAAYSKMMESQPDSPLVNEKLSEAYTSVAQLFLQKALDNYRRAIQFTPDQVELYRLALTINPNDPELLFGLAKNLVRYEDSSEVISVGGNETPMQLQGISPRALLHSVSPEPRVREAKENFDWRFYVDCYPDLNHVSSYQQAYHHWLKLGKQEGRIVSKEQFKRVYGDKIPEDFNWQEYLDFNFDLKEAINSEWQAMIHYAKSGHQEGRLYSRSQLYFQPQKKRERYN